MGFKQHDGNQMMTERSFLVELSHYNLGGLKIKFQKTELLMGGKDKKSFTCVVTFSS